MTIKMIYVNQEESIKTGSIGGINKMKVLITGGAGYLGSVLSEKLLKRGHSVRVLDNLTYGSEGLVHCGNKNYEYIYGDIRNISDVSKAINGVDAVIHLAAIVGDPASDINKSNTVDINYFSTKTIAGICKDLNVNRFIFASTCSVYGANKDKILNENSELNPVSLYAETKINSEKEIERITDDIFRPTIFRMGTLYGKSYRNRFDLVVNVLSIKSIQENQFTIFGGNQWRAFCHVSDAAEQYVRYLESPIDKVGGEVFNIVGSNHKIIDVGKIVKDITDSDMKIDETKVDERDYKVSGDKWKSTIGNRFKKTLSNGIKEIITLPEIDYKNKKYSNFKYLKEVKK